MSIFASQQYIKSHCHLMLHPISFTTLVIDMTNTTRLNHSFQQAFGRIRCHMKQLYIFFMLSLTLYKYTIPHLPFVHRVGKIRQRDSQHFTHTATLYILIQQKQCILVPRTDLVKQVQEHVIYCRTLSSRHTNIHFIHHSTSFTTTKFYLLLIKQ